MQVNAKQMKYIYKNKLIQLIYEVPFIGNLPKHAGQYK